MDYARRARADMRSLARSFRPWESMESVPPFLQIEVTNICNSNCIFCAYQYQDKFRQGRGVITDDIFEKVLSDYMQMKGTHVGLTPLCGEPLIDPDIINRAARIKRLGLWTGFFTNGVLLNRIDIEGLLLSGIDGLTISTGPFERDIYQAVYRNRRYRDLLHGLVKLISARNSLRKDLAIEIAFRSPITRKKVFALPDFLKHVDPLLTPEDRRRITVHTRGFDSWGGQITNQHLTGIMRVGIPPIVRRRPCIWTFGLYVTYNGQIRLCGCRFAETGSRDGVDELFLGNVGETSLLAAWSGPMIKSARRRFVTGDLPRVCRNCVMYRAC